MSTFRDHFENESKWQRKVLIVHLFHCKEKTKNRDWRIEDTASYFGKSKALISENLSLAENMNVVEQCSTRDLALEKLRHDKNVQ